MRTFLAVAAAFTLTGIWSAQAAESPPAGFEQWIESLGGQIGRGPDGAIVEVSVARTWATDNDVARSAEIKTIKRLELGTTYVSDRGIEGVQGLQQLEELVLDTDEFVTDAEMNYLRSNRNLRELVLRGVDITDVGMQHIAQMTNLKSLDL